MTINKLVKIIQISYNESKVLFERIQLRQYYVVDVIRVDRLVNQSRLINTI